MTGRFRKKKDLVKWGLKNRCEKCE